MRLYVTKNDDDETELSLYTNRMTLLLKKTVSETFEELRKVFENNKSLKVLHLDATVLLIIDKE